jgi:hypothetical protein
MRKYFIMEPLLRARQTVPRQLLDYCRCRLQEKGTSVQPLTSRQGTRLVATLIFMQSLLGIPHPIVHGSTKHLSVISASPLPNHAAWTADTLLSSLVSFVSLILCRTLRGALLPFLVRVHKSRRHFSAISQSISNVGACPLAHLFLRPSHGLPYSLGTSSHIGGPP